MSSQVDAAVLALLRAVPNLNVFDGYVTDSDAVEQTISAPLPYVVLFTTPGYPEGRSLKGPAGLSIEEVQVSFVGGSREQAVWACEKSRTALDDAYLSGVSGKPHLRRQQDSTFLRRDDVWTRPDGGPLFVGHDRYQAGTTV